VNAVRRASGRTHFTGYALDPTFRKLIQAVETTVSLRWDMMFIWILNRYFSPEEMLDRHHQPLYQSRDVELIPKSWFV
jgi:hypothetical protein